MPACDCGKKAYKHDGSGWFCKDCERKNKIAQDDLTKLQSRLRHEERIASNEATIGEVQYWLYGRFSRLDRRRN